MGGASPPPTPRGPVERGPAKAARGRVAGAALALFSVLAAARLLKAPGLRQPGSLRPTDEGAWAAKGIWLLAVGLALLSAVPTTSAEETRPPTEYLDRMGPYAHRCSARGNSSPSRSERSFGCGSAAAGRASAPGSLREGP